MKCRNDKCPFGKELNNVPCGDSELCAHSIPTEQAAVESSGPLTGSVSDAERIKGLEDAIKVCVSKFNSVSWGWDGDCGSQDIIDGLEDSLKQNDLNEPCGR